MNTFNSPIFLIILLSLTLNLKAYVINGYSIRDLWNIDHDFFLEEANSWTLSSAVSSARTEITTAYSETSPQVFNAPSRIILGGYNILGPSGQTTLNQYFERTYTGLQSHSFLTFQLIMFFMDYWWDAQSEAMHFLVDNTVVPGTMVDYGPDSWTFEGGNPGTLDLGFVHVRGRVPHSGPSVKFRIVSGADADSITAPFGFRDLSIYLSNYATDTSIAICQSSPESIPLANNECDCGLTMGKDSSGVCQSCANNCKHCWGVASKECYLCNDGFYWNGSGCNSCHSTCQTCNGPTINDCVTCPSGSYHYPSGICSSTSCVSGYTLVASLDGNFCTTPCNLLLETYWAANQTCLSNCFAPLVTTAVLGGLTICKNPCPSANGYLYDNGYCSATCNGLFVAKSEVGVKFCRNPCPSTAKYIYPDSTCKATCDAPFVLTTTSEGDFCKSPCFSASEFYWAANQSCLATCSSPLTNTMSLFGGLKICQNPCSPVTNYLYNNGYCSATCNSLFVAKSEVGVKFCRNPCPSTAKYIYPDSSCKSTCDAPFVLTTTLEGDFCQSPCSSPSEFYWAANQSCLADCASPLTNTMTPIGGLKICQNPCPSASNDFLYENGYCSESCNALFLEKIEVGVKFCINPCPATEKLVYPDSNCKSTCDVPFVLITTPEGDFCKSPCSSTSEFYWAANQSCIGNCSFPLSSTMTSIGNLQICQNPCSSIDDFLYIDGSCSSSCNDLFFKKIETGVKFCINPCSSSEKYIYLDSTCKSTCEYPYVISGNSTLAICVLDLDTGTVEQVKSLTETAAVGNSVSNAGEMVGSLLGASDPSSMSLGPLTKMLQFIKFMNITYPAKVELMLQSQDISSGGSFGFLKKPVRKFINLFKNQTVPGKFSVYHVSSSFIVNFWQSILMLCVIVFFILFACLLIKCLSKTSKGYSILKLVISTLKWNFFMIMYCGMIGDVVLYSALEFQTAHLDDLFSNLSVLVCAGFNVLTAVVIYAMIYVNLNIRKSKDKGESTTKEIEEKWEHFKAFWGTYRDNFFGQQIFLLVFILRVACFNAIVGYAYEYPLAQSITIVVINLLMALYLIIMRPLKARINLVQQITFEILLLVFNVSVCILAVADHTKSDVFELRKTLGDIIVNLNLIVPFLSTGFIALKIILLGYEAFRNYKNSKKNPPAPKITINKLNRKISERDESLNRSKNPMIQTNVSSLVIGDNSGILDISNYSPEQSSYLNDSHSHSHNLSMRSEMNISPSLSPLRHSPKIKKRSQPAPHSLNPNPIRLIQNHGVADTSTSPNSVFDVQIGARAFKNKPTMSPFSKKAKMLRRPQYRKQSEMRDFTYEN